MRQAENPVKYRYLTAFQPNVTKQRQHGSRYSVQRAQAFFHSNGFQKMRRIDERTIMIEPYKPRNNASPEANWNHEQNPMIPVGPML